MQNPHTTSSKQCPPSQALDAISGAAFGCICAYIREYGTPYQISRISSLISRLLQKHENKGSTTSSSFSSSSSMSSGGGGGGGGGDGGRSSSGSSDVPNWAALRQKVYELCGDWLWMHATNHWRTRVAPKMQIPVVLMDCALKVDAVDGNLGWSVMMPAEDEKQQGGTGGGGRLRKSDRRVKKKNEDEMLYLPFADYDFADNGEGLFDEGGGGGQQDRRGKSKKRQKEVDSGGQQAVGSKKRKKNRNSKDSNYNGVMKRKDVEGNVRYYAQTGKKSWNSKLSLGSFATEEEAAMAVDLAKHLVRKDKNKTKEFSMMYQVSSVEECTAIWKKYDHIYLEMRDKFLCFDDEATESKYLAALRNMISQEISKWVDRRGNSDGGSKASNANNEGAITNTRGDSSQALEMRKRLNESIIKVAKLSSPPHGNNDWIAALYYMIFLFSPVEERRKERLRRRRVAILSFRIMHCILSSQARRQTSSSSNKGHSTVMPKMNLADYPINDQMVLMTLVKNLKMCDFAEANETRSHGIKQAMVYSLAQCLKFLFDNNKTINVGFNLVHFVQEMWMYRQSENNPLAKKAEWQHADDKDFHTESNNVIPTAISFVGRFYTEVGDYDYSVKDGFVLALNKDFENMKGGEEHENEHHDKQRSDDATVTEGEEMSYDVFAKCLERLAKGQGDVEGIKMPLLGNCFMACSI